MIEARVKLDIISLGKTKLKARWHVPLSLSSLKNHLDFDPKKWYIYMQRKR